MIMIGTPAEARRILILATKYPANAGELHAMLTVAVVA